ncbi:Tetratricopeptide repeat protein 27 [Hypsibius exemplaris]|uniref:Tetratricopeptide repeat protein 27 n=1 Tax=Hypsibius exemplaris TaxID=2072580 RepID=A0A1W0WL21_HYPEX|nr:Tetratricopeptide repeat protein 27 [Hypsibius exemplaris]
MTTDTSTARSSDTTSSPSPWTPEILAILAESLNAIVYHSSAAGGDVCATPLGRWIAANPSEALLAATEASQAFLRENFTGPPSSVASNPLHPFHDVAVKFLSDPEPIYRLCRAPEYLAVGIVILELLRSADGSGKYHSTSRHQANVVLIQLYWMQQCTLEEKSAVLHQKISALLNEIKLAGESENDSAAVEHLLLACIISLYYSDLIKANEYLAEAKSHCRHSSLLTGILGKRTRFQEQEYAQLVVELQRAETVPEPASQIGFSNFPVNVALDDDTLLKEAELTKDLPHTLLADHEAAVLLVEGLVSRRKRARTTLQDEEHLAYIQLALHSSNCYAIRSSALFDRSRLEGDKSRRTTRAMQQLEVLMMSFRDTTHDPILRAPFALAVNVPPSWKVEEALGFLLLQNGITNEAINIFTSLELWEDVIECYQRVGQKVKAEDLIMKELAKEETAVMWCRLGDIREDVACYDKAWELSQHRSARSRRDLGRLLLRRQDYQGAADALRQGLDINAIDAGAWFSMGYCQLKLGEFGQAELSLRRCVNLDPDNALAWNNLGSIALRGQDYNKAYRILQDSIKADYDNWNVWDNYQNACLKVKDFEEEIKACYRLLELKGRLNVDSLGLLVAAVIDGVADIHGVSAARLLPKVKELFGAMSVKLTDNSKVWYLYGKLNASELERAADETARKEVLQAVVMKLQRSFRCAVKETDWEREDYSLINTLNVAKELGNYQRLLIAAETDDTEQRSVRSSCRVMLDSVISRVEKSCTNFATGSLAVSEEAASLLTDIRAMRAQL